MALGDNTYRRTTNLSRGYVHEQSLPADAFGSNLPPRSFEAKHILRSLLLNAVLVSIAWTPSLSQSKPQVTPRLGLVGGANLATLTSNFVQNARIRAGFAAGVLTVLPASPSVAIQPELMFTRKGADSKPGGTDERLKIDYLELPVLARFKIPLSGRMKPFVYGGPGFAYRTNCTIEGHTFVINEPQRAIRMGCDSLARQAAQASPGAKFSRTDVDGIVGGGLALNVGGRLMTVGVRYDVGFVKLITYNDSKNRVLSFISTLEWPLQK